MSLPAKKKPGGTPGSADMGSIDHWPGFGSVGRELSGCCWTPELCAMGAALPVEVPPAEAPLPAPCAPLASEPPLALLSLAPPLKVVPFSAKTAVDEKNKVDARMAAPQILSVMNNRPGLSCNTCQDPRFAAASPGSSKDVGWRRPRPPPRTSVPTTDIKISFVSPHVFCREAGLAAPGKADTRRPFRTIPPKGPPR